MTEQELVAAALKLGFSKAAVIDTGKIVFEPSFRIYCQDNLCGKYGANYSCPPDCGTTDHMKAKILAYPKAIVLQTLSPIEDITDNEQVKPLKAAHNLKTRALLDLIDPNGLMAGASGCSLCSPCAITEGLPCRFPEKAYSCLSAYCVYVKELARLCGMEYFCESGTLALFSLCCFAG